MCTNDKFEQEIIGRQTDTLRLGKNKYGLCPEQLSDKTGISQHTWNSYFGGTKMPITNLMRYLELVPDEFGSRFFKPIGKCVVEPLTEAEALIETLAMKASGFATDYLERKEDGIICHIDKKALSERAQEMGIIATKIGQGA